jgi:hypothetical protein
MNESDLINPAPVIYERRAPRRRKVGLFTVENMPSFAALLDSCDEMRAPMLQCMQAPASEDEDSRDPIDALEVFEVRCQTIAS